MISKVICDLHFSLNQPSKSADDSYTGISKSIIKLSWICRLFPFQLVLIFPCNLTKCRLWDFDIILVKHSVKSNKLYIATGSAHLPPPHAPAHAKKNYGRVYTVATGTINANTDDDSIPNTTKQLTITWKIFKQRVPFHIVSQRADDTSELTENKRGRNRRWIADCHNKQGCVCVIARKCNRTDGFLRRSQTLRHGVKDKSEFWKPITSPDVQWRRSDHKWRLISFQWMYELPE